MSSTSSVAVRSVAVALLLALLCACASAPPPPPTSKHRLADDFHLFAVEWDKDNIRWFIDDIAYANVPTPADPVFHKPFFMLLNLAVGGNWPGFPDDTTAFPQTMAVDYVRVYAGLPGQWKLTWSDEFNGSDGSAPDKTKWTYDVGSGGWGNRELQTYTDERENSKIVGGKLLISAIKNQLTHDGVHLGYGSARLKTKGLFAQAYGRFEARIKVAYGEGIWPAFWMLGASYPEADWPDCGEIDIMENIGREPSVVHGTIHGRGFSGAGGISRAFMLP